VAGSSPWTTQLHSALPDRWASVLGDDALSQLEQLGKRLDERAGHEDILPAPHHVFRALEIPPEQVEVIIIGQDPYPTPGHAMGLAFSVPEGVWPLPPTLKNIVRELSDDIGLAPPRHGSLLSWHRQGVLMINRHLTTAASQPGSHSSLGWAAITNRIVEHLAWENQRRVAILWGRAAQEVAPLLGDMPTISTPHPSPLAAHRGFFGSKPFSRTNQYREAMGLAPIDWSLDQVTGCQPG